jgi:hypothetical protein
MVFRRTLSTVPPDTPLPTLSPPQAIIELRANQHALKREVDALWDETRRLTGLRLLPHNSQEYDTSLAAELRETMERRQRAQAALTDLQEEEHEWLLAESGPFIKALHEHYIGVLARYKEALIEACKQQEMLLNIIKHGMSETRGRYPAPVEHLMPVGLQDCINRIELYLERQEKGYA